jgi:hypothetical protein
MEGGREMVCILLSSISSSSLLPLLMLLFARNVFGVSLRLLSMPSIKSTAWPDYNTIIVFSGKRKFLGGEKRHESP